MLGPAADLRRDADRCQLALQQRDDVLDVALAILPPLVEKPRDAPVLVGLERAQRKILELPLELPDAEAIGERRIDIDHLARDGATTLGIAGHQPAHRLRALGELDQDYADVLDHRQQHLAQVLGLQRAFVRVGACGNGVHRVHPRHVDDQRRDVLAERGLDRGGIEAGDARQAEQQCRNQRIGIEPLGGENGCGAERGLDQKLAIVAARIAEARAGHVIGRGDTLAVGSGVDRRQR